MKEKKMSKGGGMPYFEKEHWEKDAGTTEVADLKYAGKDTMDNPERLKKSVDDLAGYAKKNQMKY